MTKAKILIVEDEFIIRHDLKISLEKMGYRVIATAVEAEESISKAAAFNPDIVLMDIQLEGEKDGIDAAATIKEQLNIPIIFTTAFSDEGKTDRAKLNMPYGYLIKPVQKRELKITIDMALYAAKMNADRKQIEEEREKLVKELQDALDNVKTLKGMLPICANCKKIRDDQGYWSQIESYIEKNSEALFTHSVCPECAEKLYGDTKWYKKIKKTEQ